MDNLLKFYIDGEWTAPASDTTMPVFNPATEEQIGTVAMGNSSDVPSLFPPGPSANLKLAGIDHRPFAHCKHKPCFVHAVFQTF